MGTSYSRRTYTLNLWFYTERDSKASFSSFESMEVPILAKTSLGALEVFVRCTSPARLIPVCADRGKAAAPISKFTMLGNQEPPPHSHCNKHDVVDTDGHRREEG